MNAETFRLLKKTLKHKFFRKGVDLGCGEGFYGPLFKQHCTWLIGVDHNIPRLTVAKEFSGYDEVVHCKIQDYIVSYDIEIVFMIESLEHLSKTEGQILLDKLNFVPYILLTTPSVFRPFGFRNGHQSLWIKEDLEQYNFETILYNYGFPVNLLVKKGIFAVKQLK